jgi:hypothetical protein
MRLKDLQAAFHVFQEGLKLRQAASQETKDLRQKLNMQPTQRPEAGASGHPLH